MKLIKSRVGLMALALFMPSQLIAATPVCINIEEIGAFIDFIAPVALKNAKKTCANILPQNSYLLVNADELARKFESNQPLSRPFAESGLMKFSDSKDMAMAKELKDVDLVNLVMVMAEAKVKIKESDCEGLNLVLEPLDPLPIENLKKIVASIGYLTTKDKQNAKSDIAICKP